MAGLIAQEWIEDHGGAEKVLLAMLEALPDSEFACLWNDDDERFKDQEVHESWIARTPLRGRKALALPLMPATWRYAWRKQAPEWVLTSSYVFAHHLRVRYPEIPKFSYVHTPARYFWAPELDNRTSNAMAGLARSYFRFVDRRRVGESGQLAANSEFVRARIRDSWQVDSRVIYPPVDAKQIAGVSSWADHLSAAEQEVLASLPEKGFLLAASRLVPYTGHSRVMDMAEALDLPVVITGNGPERERLESKAATLSVPTHFLGRVSDEMLRALFQRALAFVFPPVEDFGIIPVEAMAAGASVVVNRVGGTSETVEDGVSGAHFDPNDPSGFESSIRRAASITPESARASSFRFDHEVFLRSIREWVTPAASHAEPGSVREH